jgi:hypothetical protein
VQLFNIFSHVVNLLIVIPTNCYLNLITRTSSDHNIIVHQEMDMTTIDTLLKFLNNKLDNEANLIENLSPIITCFIKICKAEKLIRKYVRIQVQCFYILILYIIY